MRFTYSTTAAPYLSRCSLVRRLCILALIVAAVVGPTRPSFAQDGLLALADGETGLVRDAAEYAKDVGVSHEEAIRRLKLDRLAGKLATTLEANESDTLAAVWLQHKPEFRAIVAFTRDGERTIRPHIDGGPLEGIVEVRRADATRAELLAADEETVRIMRRLQLPFYIETTLRRNRVLLHVTARERLESELREARERLPEHVEVVEVRQLPVGGVSSP